MNIKEFVLEIAKQNATDIVLIIALFFLGRIILKFIIKRLIRVVDDGDDTQTSQKEQRAETLGHVVIATGNIIINAIILLMILNLFGVDIRPILAGIGVLGLAVGFGAQSLVKDFVSGLFILIENQYGVGDKVKIGSAEGRVIKITMRSTMLRDDDGKIYHLSNGAINNVVNFSQHKNPS